MRRIISKNCMYTSTIIRQQLWPSQAKQTNKYYVGSFVCMLIHEKNTRLFGMKPDLYIQLNYVYYIFYPGLQQHHCNDIVHFSGKRLISSLLDMCYIFLGSSFMKLHSLAFLGIGIILYYPQCPSGSKTVKL